MQRIIALIDCDCFFVSCERVKDPKLQGKPVCVMTGGGDKGIIVSRSKEAKALGVKMGEPYFKAKVEHPDAICIPAHHSLYHEISQQVMDTIRDFTPDGLISEHIWKRKIHLFHVDFHTHNIGMIFQ